MPQNTAIITNFSLTCWLLSIACVTMASSPTAGGERGGGIKSPLFLLAIEEKEELFWDEEATCLENIASADAIKYYRGEGT